MDEAQSTNRESVKPIDKRQKKNVKILDSNENIVIPAVPISNKKQNVKQTETDESEQSDNEGKENIRNNKKG